MWRPLLLLFSVSITIACKPEKDQCGQWGGADLPKANTHFAISLYKWMSSKTARSPSNIFLSPFSIYTTLAMLGLGARSSTRQQIMEAMCLDATQANKTLKEDYQNFLAKCRIEKGDVAFRSYNWLFLDKSVPLLPQYQKDVTGYYNASIQSIDFSQPQTAEQRINEQVSGRTHGKIEDLVSNLDGRTVMVLLDYASFNAKWERPFTSQETQCVHFRLNQEKTAQVQMMHRVDHFKTYKDCDCFVIEVPYTKELILLLIVPNEGQMAAVQQKLSVPLIEGYLSKTRTSLLDLHIPKISLEQKVNVQYALLNMGILQAFSETAELSRISGKPGLKVSRIYHKTLINIAENGTESSGAEVIQGIRLPKAFELKVDRPFLAFVYSKQMKTILLLGSVSDPSQN